MAVINQKIANYNIDPAFYGKLGIAETNGNTNAVNPQKGQSAAGKYQFIEETWKYMVKKYNLGYSLQDRFDPEKALKVTKLFTIENEAYLKAKLKIEPNNQDLYAAHWLGNFGAEQFLRAKNSNPNAPISSVMSRGKMEVNKSYVRKKNGQERTVSEVYDYLGERMGGEKVKENETVVTTTQNNINIEQVDTTRNAMYKTGIPYTNTKYKESKEVEQAQMEVAQAQAEEDFTEEYFKNQEAPQPQQQVTPQQALPEQTIIDHFNTANEILTRQQGGIIKDNMGQWKYPGEITQIASPNITMKGVNYPVFGVADTGEKKIMMPNLEYYFKGAKTVTEYPITKQ